MAAVRVIDDLFFATPLLLLLLLLCSLWRLSTESNSTTATIKRMRTHRAPNERFARGKGGARRDEDVLENSEQLNADPLQPASRPRSSLQVAFACPTLPAYQTRPERTPNTHTNSIRLTTSREVNEARLPHTCSRPCAFEEKINKFLKTRKNPPHPKHTTKSTAARRPRPPRDGLR